MAKLRQKRELRGSLHKRVACYTLAAAGMAGAAPSAAAAIVYTSAKEFREGHLNFRPVYAPIDLNHDGQIDFDIIGTFRSEFVYSFTIRTGLVFATAIPGNQIAIASTISGAGVAQALNLGQEVGPDLRFSSAIHHTFVMADFVSIGFGPQSALGQFYNQRNKFVALKLAVGGDIHYGWARLSVKPVGDKLAFELADYAYQSTPNVPILAGQGIPKPDAASLLDSGAESATLGGPSLGALAYGADALLLWRK